MPVRRLATRKVGGTFDVKEGKVVAAKAKEEVWSKREEGWQAGRLAVSEGLVPLEQTNGGLARGGSAERISRALRDTSR